MNRGIVLCLCVLSCAVSGWAEPGVLETVDQLTGENKLRESRVVLEKALTKATVPEEQSEVLWRLSRLTYLETEQKKQTREDSSRLLKAYEQGADLAARALAANPRSPEAFFWRASNWGSWAQAKGGLDALGKATAARDDLAAAIRLKPDFGPACYVLGLLYGSLPGWPLSFGNKEFGISLLRRAMDLAEKPEHTLGYRLNLAVFLWERNWSAAVRGEKRKFMSRSHDEKKLMDEKYCFYEGKADFSREVLSGGRTLQDLSDREEARAQLAFVEEQAERLLTKSEDVEKIKEAVASIRDSLR